MIHTIKFFIFVIFFSSYSSIVNSNIISNCKNCGKKYYPKSYYSYPQFHWGTSDEDKLEYARFHSLGCMTEWLRKNKEAFANLVDNISQNVIQEENHK